MDGEVLTMGRRQALRPAAVMLCGLLAAGGAAAHDTWFEALGTPGAAGRVLSLGTGNRFPKQEYPLGAEQLARKGCASATGPVRLDALRFNDHALLLRAAPAGDGAVSCWTQLIAFDVEVPLDKVPVYLDEIHAGEDLRTRWAALQARGLPWKERYTKFARLELGSAAHAPASRPSGLAMDLMFDAPQGPLRSGAPQTVRATRVGRPLPGLWLELLDATGTSAGWQRSDADGRATVTLPHAGRWLLRGVDLRPEGDSAWVSRFVTLAFDVGN
jgi:hypothetical protein